jgi:hypothetical protein
MYEVGQVWQITWASGDEALSGKRMVKSRVGILSGIEMAGGTPSRLYFSCPMLKDTNSTTVYPRDFQAQNPKLIGVLAVYEPEPEPEPTID